MRRGRSKIIIALVIGLALLVGGGLLAFQPNDLQAFFTGPSPTSPSADMLALGAFMILFGGLILAAAASMTVQIYRYKWQYRTGIYMRKDERELKEEHEKNQAD